MSRPAAFLDRDGTLIPDVGYLDDPDRVALLPGTVEGLRRLAAAGYALVLVTNQSGLARGYFDEARLAAIHVRLAELLARAGAPALEAIYHCPHHPDGVVERYACVCECRKPAPGMLLRAAAELDLSPARSLMVGDGERDVEAGRRAGCAHSLRVDPDAPAPADGVVADLAGVADWLGLA